MHALVTRGGGTEAGEWVPVPYVDERAAEELCRHKVLGLLRRRGLLSQERIELLLDHLGLSSPELERPPSQLRYVPVDHEGRELDAMVAEGPYSR